MNECKRALRSQWRKAGNIEEYANELHFETQEHSDLFYAVMELPEKYRTAIYLYYYEDYSTDEIARLTAHRQPPCAHGCAGGRELLRAGLEEAKSNV